MLRIKTAFAIVTIAVGILIILDIIFSLGLESILFSPIFGIPALTIAYIFAPVVTKRIPFKKGIED